jgi:hypothetical protein
VGATGPTGYNSFPVPSSTGSKGDAGYTLVLGDANTEITFALLVSTRTLTVPTNASVAFPIGTKFYITLTSGTTGALAISGAGGVTIRGNTQLAFVGATTVSPKACILWKIATDTWLAL